MIDEIEIQGFKSLKHVKLKLGRFNLFIGANAGGKSNFLEALRVLQGLAYGFTVSEVFGGKAKSSTSEVWEGIRGGIKQAPFAPSGGEPDNIIWFTVGRESLKFSIAIDPTLVAVKQETLFEGDTPILFSVWTPHVSAMKARVYATAEASEKKLRLDNERAALPRLHGRFSRQRESLVESMVNELRDAQSFEPSIEVLKQYSSLPGVKRMGDRGENFASLLKTVFADRKSKEAYDSWINELTPIEASKSDLDETPGGEWRFSLIEDGHRFPALVLSDGTLRFAAFTAAFFQPDLPSRLTLEEIENGVHPTRLRSVIQLLKSQSEYRKTQVFATTHSPAALAWLDKGDYETTFLCHRDPATGASSIRPLTEVPHFLKVIRKNQIADLFTSGWFESIL
jgi:energy-coupling factor transporter ATP-binding protein EcfA2